MSNRVENRKENILKFLKENKNYLEILGLILLIILAFILRTSNLSLLKDITTGLYIPADPDSSLFLRYAKYILEHGSLMTKDVLRYYPLGHTNLYEFNFLTNFIVYFYKFLHFFSSNVTLEYADVIFPAVTFCIALVFFYLLVKKLFDYRVALLASAFLTFMPPFLHRTISGVGDKEALAIIFFFASLYFYIFGLKSENKYSYLIGIISGVFTSLLGLVWGGVSFILLIIAFYMLVSISTNNFKRKDFYLYISWWFSTVFLLDIFSPLTYSFRFIVKTLPSQITTIALIGGFLYLFINEFNVFNIKTRLKLDNYPIGMIYFTILGLTGVIILPLIVTYNYSGDFNFYVNFLFTESIALLYYITKPFSLDRFSLTVEENVKTYVVNLYSNFGKIYFLFLICASIFLFYEMFKDLKKYKFRLTASYSIFIIFFIFSSYSKTSILNGKSIFSEIILILSSLVIMFVFLGYFLYSLYKNKENPKIEPSTNEKEKVKIEKYNKELKNYKELYNTFTNISPEYIFLFLWFLITLASAKSADRLIFIFVPITTIFVAYFLIKIYDYSLSTEDKFVKWMLIIILFLLIFAPFINGSLIERGITAINTAQRTGPSFDQQWQHAMSWVRQNTPKDSVFAHWWDYGYWVQTFGERATLSDGGNARGAINFFIGRHLLTGRNNTEALELLKAHNATHVLIVSDEISKYASFSSIGSDENYDKYSEIPLFLMNPKESQLVKDKNNKEIILYLYKGLFVLDEDFIYNEKIFPKHKAVIKGIVLTTNKEYNTKEIKEIIQPLIIITYNNLKEEVPLNCVFLNSKEYVFHSSNGYNGCLRITPVVTEEGINYIQAGLFLSPNTRNTLFTNLYLFDKNEKNSKDWLGFKKVYDDSKKKNTLAYYPDYERIIGPIKIWELTYPKNIKTNYDYLKTEVPNPNIELVKDQLS